MLKSHYRLPLFFISVFLLFLTCLPQYLFALTTAETHKAKGNEYYEAKEYALAIREYTKALMENPDYSAAYYNRGLAHYDLRLYYKAIVDFDMAIMLDPDDSDYYYSRGLAYNKVDKLELALSDVKKAAKMGDEDAGRLLGSGLLNRRIDKARQKNLKIDALINDKSNIFNRAVKVINRNNDLGGDTVVTVYSKGDPLYDGKDGIFKKIEYFDAQNHLKKTELLHTSQFNTVNGRNKTTLIYNDNNVVIKKVYFYTGKMLNVRGIHTYDDSGKFVRKGLYDKHGNPMKKQ